MFNPSDLQALSDMLATSEKLQKEKEKEQLVKLEEEAKRREEEEELNRACLEVSDDMKFDDELPEPVYRTLYSQIVKPEEVYGGFTGMTPGTSDSQLFVVEVDVEPDDVKHLDLDVTRHHLLLRIPHKRLYMTLPHPVDQDSVKAKYLQRDRRLRVELRRLDLLVE